MNARTKTTLVMGLTVMLIGASLAIGQPSEISGDRQGPRGGKGMRGHRPPPPPKGPFAMLRAPKVKDMLRRLKLTEDQRKQVHEIMRESRQGLRDIEDKEARHEARKQARTDAWKKVYDQVLTAEQKAKVDAARAKKKDIALSDAQEVKIKEIMKAAHDKIYKEVLTDKQREAVDEWKENRHKRGKGGEGWGGPGGRRGGRHGGRDHKGPDGDQTGGE